MIRGAPSCFIADRVGEDSQALGATPIRDGVEMPTAPSAVYANFDKVQIWLKHPVDHKTLSRLRRGCGKGGMYVDNRRAKFDLSYRQRIELRQPSDDALRLLLTLGSVHLNRLELALDFVFDDPDGRDAGFEFLHEHLVRRWHGRRQQIRLYRGVDDGDGSHRGRPQRVDDAGIAETRYDAGRWAPNSIVFYREASSRITGEANCLHLEWRANGRRAVRRAGINSVQGPTGV